MAALQKIRSKGVLLVAVLGLALFAFIAEEFFRSLETTSMMDRNQVGEVYGKKLSIQDFQALVDEQTEVMKMQMMVQGQEPNITDQQTEQIREQVWQQFVQNAIIEHECEKVGLEVTDGEVQEALRLGQASSLQTLAPIFGNQQTGQFDLAQLQAFLKDYKKSLAQAQQQQNAQAVEQLQMVKKLWDYSEKQLRQELLSNKYNVLFYMGFVSNKVGAELAFNERAVMKNAEVAAVPYSMIEDKDAKVSDDEVKAVYNQYKELFYNPTESRDIKVLDVMVQASAEDRAELMKKVQGFEAQLREGKDVAQVVRTAGSAVQYSNMCLSKKAFSRMGDVNTALDSMAVGAVKATYYSAADNTINTLKLIAKAEMPDSILFRQIAAQGDTPEARKAQADSILNALNAGAKFADLAKKYGQRTDSAWVTSNMYESFGMADENAEYLTTLSGIAANSAKVYSNENGAVVLQVLDRKKMVTKYNVAIVKCPLNFSKKTYEGELSKLNRYLAANKTIEAFAANAAKSGYMVADVPAYAPTNNVIPQQIGGSQAKDAARWIFDEAEAGDISKLYECGRNGDHLLVVAISATNKKGYLPLSESEVKDYCTNIARQNKKAEMLAGRLKAAKTLDDFKKERGFLMGHLSAESFAGRPSLLGVNVPEPVLAATLAKTAVGKTSGVVKGAGAVYMVKVTGENKSKEKFNAQSEMQQVANGILQRTARPAFFYLQQNEAGLVDHRYQF